MIRFFKSLILKYRLRKAVAKAKEAKELTNRKHIVILFKGKPTVLSKQRLTHMVRTRKFKKGTKVQDVERLALFTTL